LLSLNAIKSLEAGKGKLSTFIAILHELGALDDIDHFVLEIMISPIESAKRRGKNAYELEELVVVIYQKEVIDMRSN